MFYIFSKWNILPDSSEDVVGGQHTSVFFKDDYIDIADESDDDADPDEASNSRFGNPDEFVKHSKFSTHYSSILRPADDDEFGFGPPDDAPPRPSRSATSG